MRIARVCVGLLACLAVAAEPPPDVIQLQSSVVKAIKEAEVSVACILVSRTDDLNQRNLANPETVPESYGSGVVIDPNGLILTNYHVVRDSSNLYVRLPGGKGSAAKIHAADPRSDLAVIKVTKADILPLPAIKMGAADHLQKGQFAIVIANPFAAGYYDGSPSSAWGIISNIRRRAPGRPTRQEQDRSRLSLHHYGTLLQLDARLNLGCSGGALVDLKGELIGLTTALAAVTGSETAGGYAVPMDAAMKRIVGVLKEGREVEYGFLGVSTDTSPFARIGGVRTTLVIPGSPAALAGIRDNDMIIEADHQPIRDTDDLFLAMGTALAGREIQLNVLGRGHTVPVRLAKFYVPGPVIASNRPGPVHGLHVEWASVPYQRDNLRGEMPPGVYVTEVEPGSSADREHLAGLFVTQVDGNEVTAPEEFYRLASSKSGPIRLTLWNRDGPDTVREVTIQ